MASFTVGTTTVSDRLRSSDFRSWSRKPFLANAFALGRLARVTEFHLSPCNTYAPVKPSWSLPPGLEPTRTEVMFAYSMKLHSGSPGLLWALWFFQSKSCGQAPAPDQGHQDPPGNSVQGRTDLHRLAERRPIRLGSNYELFNCNSFNIRYWSWNYRGCWHQTCPPIDPCWRI